MSSKAVRFCPWTGNVPSGGSGTPIGFSYGTNNGPQSYSAATNVNGTIIYGYAQQTGSGVNRQLLMSWINGQIRNHGLANGGSFAQVLNIKRDGSVVCGYCDSSFNPGNQQWYTWTPSGGFNLSPIPALPSPWSYPYEINDISQSGGPVIVGTAGPDGDASGNNAAGVAWTLAHGSVQLPVLAGFANATPTAISTDGTTIVGGVYGTSGSHACYWKTPDGGATWPITDLGSFGVTTAATIAWDCTSDGSTIVGTGNPSSGVTQSWIWTSGTGMTNIGVPAGGHTWNTLLVRGCSESISAPILTGLAFDNTAGVQHIFTWTSAGGFTLLTPFGGSTAPDSNAISQDGTVVAGDTRAFATRTVL